MNLKTFLSKAICEYTSPEMEIYTRSGNIFVKSGDVVHHYNENTTPRNYVPSSECQYSDRTIDRVCHIHRPMDGEYFCFSELANRFNHVEWLTSTENDDAYLPFVAMKTEIGYVTCVKLPDQSYLLSHISKNSIKTINAKYIDNYWLNKFMEVCK